jgi:hypothetical protein
MERSIGILETNRDILDRSAQALLEKETLSAKDLEELSRPLARLGQPKNVCAPRPTKRPAGNRPGKTSIS